MPATRASAFVAALLALLAVAGPSARAAAPPPVATISVDEVKPGMTGYGLTVFRGTRPERFAVRVIDVVRRFLPQQDIVLIDSDDPRLVHSGIVAGMSGSPIYLSPSGKGGDERLVGALAYGWAFSRDPIAGVTPIAAMLAESARPLRGKARTPVGEAWNEPREGAPPPAPVAARSDGSTPRLVPAAVPIALAGFAPRAARELADALAPFGLVPVEGGAGGGPVAAGEGSASFEAGGAISIQLIRGDMSAAGTGTVTYVDGARVLAFGHPMFNLGESYFPATTAVVHTIVPALSTSFKLAAPLREAGSLVQDRQACIVVDTGLRSDMIPMTVTLGERVFRAEIARHRLLTPSLAASVVGNAAHALATDVTDTTFTVRTRIVLRSPDGQSPQSPVPEPLDLVDHGYSPEGLGGRTLAGTNGLKALSELLGNPFQPTSVARIEVQVESEPKTDVAEIVGLALASDVVEPGSRPSLRVTLRPFAGPEVVQAVPIDIPAALAGTLVKIEVAAGNLVKPDQAPPEGFAGFVANLRKGYPARALVVTLQTPDDALALRGSVVGNLPMSVLDTLKPGASVRKTESFKVSARTVVGTRPVLVGKQEIQIKVRDASLD